MSKKSLKDIKVENTAKVLKEVLKQDDISRIEISDKTGLSPSTVTLAVSSLLEEGILEEVSQGISTGGRKPVQLRIRGNYGSVLVAEVKRSGVNIQIFDMTGKMIGYEKTASRKLSGNDLMNAISGFILRVKAGETVYPTKILGLGLLCQDDIPEYDLMVEYSTSLSSDLVRIESLLSSRFGITVKKELINRYNLNYYLNSAEANYTDYAYVNLGERITASFVVNNSLVRNSTDSVFDLSSAVLCGNYAGTEEGHPSGGIAYAQEIALKKVSASSLADKLIQVLKSAMLFFPVKNIFIGGEAMDMDTIVNHISAAFTQGPVIRKLTTPARQINDKFASQMIKDNCSSIVGAL